MAPSLRVTSTTHPKLAPPPPRPPRSTVPLFRAEAFASAYPTAKEGQFYPGLARPAPLHYADVHSTPLSLDDKSFHLSHASGLNIHRRLLRALHLNPTVCIFPYLINPLQSKGRQHQRDQRNKVGDEKYYFTLANFLAWELGRRTVRLAIFESMLGPEERKGNRTHVWAGAIVDRAEGRGKDLVFFDDSSEHSENQRPDGIERGDIFRPQRDLSDLLRSQYKMDIHAVWWGGRKEDVGIRTSDGVMCLESSLRFVELFSKDIEANGGVLDGGILEKWHMREV